MPYGLWGRIKKTVGGVSLMARAETKSSNMNKFDVDLLASVADSKVLLEGVADAEASSVSVENVEVTQGFDAPGGSLTVKPRYNIPSGKGDVKVAYAVSDVKVTIDATKTKQKVAVEKFLGGDLGSIKPSINTNGDIEVDYIRPLGSGILTVGYKPNTVVDLKYTDGPWEATISAPANNLRNFDKEVNFKVRRAFDVTE